MKLYRTRDGPVLERTGSLFRLDTTWDELIRRDNLPDYLDYLERGSLHFLAGITLNNLVALPPVESQEIWGAGVTYLRSREARKEESSDAGGGEFYARVYDAERPELFFKSPSYRVRGPGQAIRMRSDAQWTVPEPELALVYSRSGKRIGYTIGNDVTSRDIEGENPLYLPQAKIYDGSCALGPGILVTPDVLPPETEICLTVQRGRKNAFAGKTSLSQMKRTEEDLGSYLFRELSFPDGCILMTGTGVIPPSDFALKAGDKVQIKIEPIGTLTNTVTV